MGTLFVSMVITYGENGGYVLSLRNEITNERNVLFSQDMNSVCDTIGAFLARAEKTT